MTDARDARNIEYAAMLNVAARDLDARAERFARASCPNIAEDFRHAARTARARAAIILHLTAARGAA